MINLLIDWTFWVLLVAVLLAAGIYHLVGWWLRRVDRHGDVPRDLPCIGGWRPSERGLPPRRCD